MKDKLDIYTIRQVIELTGVSEFLLRVWELRYSAITPKRSETGRRQYTHADILKIASLHTLIKKGYRIGKIAHLNTNELQKMIQKSFIEKTKPAPTSKNSHQIVDTLYKYVSKLDWDKVRQIFYSETSDTETEQIIFNFILPICQKMNELSATGNLTITQEHILTAFLKESLHKLRSLHNSQKLNKKYKFIFATPEGDMHDLGLLISCCLASHYKLDNLYLGAHLPKKDLAETCLQSNGTHLVLVSTLSKKEGAHEDFLSYLNFIDKHTPKKIKILIGGRSTSHLIINLQREIQVVSSLEQMNDYLKTLS